MEAGMSSEHSYSSASWVLLPSQRLLWWAGLVCVPLLAVAIAMAGSIAGLAALIGLMLIMLVLIADGMGCAALGKEMTLACKDDVMLARSQYGRIVLSLQQAPPVDLRAFLGLPPCLGCNEMWIRAAAPAPAPASAAAGDVTLCWALRPRRRGSWQAREVVLAMASPWSLWTLQRHYRPELTIRVLPDIRTVYKDCLLMQRRTMVGQARMRLLGRGREYEKLREYQPGDSFEDIHWKATAKHQRLITKEYQMERRQAVYVVVDASRLSGRPAEGGGTPESILERFIQAALGLLLTTDRVQDDCGLVVFTDRIRAFLPAKHGRDHVQRCRELLGAVEQSEDSPDFEEIGNELRTRIRQRALLVFLTNLDDPVLAADFTRQARLLSRQHIVMADMYRPAGAEPLFTTKVVEPAAVYHALAGHLRWRQLRSLMLTLRRDGVRLALLAPGPIAGQLSRQYLAIKQRQLV